MKTMLYIAIAAIIFAQQLHAQQVGIEDPNDMIMYSPGTWVPEYPHNYVVARIPQDSVCAYVIGVYGTLPKYGYPKRWALFNNMYDTLQVGVSLRNPTDKSYILAGKQPEDWFTPSVFEIEQDINNAAPVADSYQLGYRFQRWIGRPDTIPARHSTNLVYDVWNLPQGVNRIVFAATKKLPKDITERRGGGVYELFDAVDLADSTNAIEARFRLLMVHGNLSAAKTLPDTIFQWNPNSFVAWAMRKDWYKAKGDTNNTKAALDHAIKILELDIDPVAPDSLARSRDDLLYYWRLHYLNNFKIERSRLN